MINQILKAGIIFQVWRWLRLRWKLLISSLLIILITWILHGEYTDYMDKSDSVQYLGISYLLKWMITLGVVLFVYSCEKLRTNNQSSASSKHESTATTKMHKSDSDIADPFEKIRKKKELESRADKLLK